MKQHLAHPQGALRPGEDAGEITVEQAKAVTEGRREPRLEKCRLPGEGTSEEDAQESTGERRAHG